MYSWPPLDILEYMVPAGQIGNSGKYTEVIALSLSVAMGIKDLCMDGGQPFTVR